MDKVKLRKHLEEASKRLIVFTKTNCFNDFSNRFHYIIKPNVRTVDLDDDHLNEKEKLVLESWNSVANKPLTIDQVVEFFHHDNKVPLWVDITVYEARPRLTVVELVCSRRLREEGQLMHQWIHPPFHLQVALPPGHLKKEKDGRFDVNWKKKRDDKKNPISFFRSILFRSI